MIVPPQTMRSQVIKNIHNDIHCGITAMHKRQIRRLMIEIFERHRTVHKKMLEMYEDKGFSTKKNIHSWSTEKEPWNRVHIDQ